MAVIALGALEFDDTRTGFQEHNVVPIVVGRLAG